MLRFAERKHLLAFVIACFAAAMAHAQESPVTTETDEPYIIEYYYKIKWGHQEEFLELYKRNHWPILKDALASGDIVDIRVEAPAHHASEAKRWDLRVTVIWRSAAAYHAPFDLESVLATLFQDREKFEREEKRRLELIEEHMDIPIDPYDISQW